MQLVGKLQGVNDSPFGNFGTATTNSLKTTLNLTFNQLVTKLINLADTKIATQKTEQATNFSGPIIAEINIYDF